MDIGPGMIFKDPRRGDWLFWLRKEGEQDVFVGSRGGVIVTRKLTEADLLERYVLVHDTAGRTEAELARVERERTERERDALNKTLQSAGQWLSKDQMDELRDFYFTELKKGTPSA